MSLAIYDENATKQAINLSINSDLLRQARELKLNVSKAAEEKLAELVRAERQRQWQEENREALDVLNEHVRQHGLFSDGLRTFGV